MKDAPVKPSMKVTSLMNEACPEDDGIDEALHDETLQEYGALREAPCRKHSTMTQAKNPTSVTKRPGLPGRRSRPGVTAKTAPKLPNGTLHEDGHRKVTPHVEALHKDNHRNDAYRMTHFSKTTSVMKYSMKTTSTIMINRVTRSSMKRSSRMYHPRCTPRGSAARRHKNAQRRCRSWRGIAR